jgi:WD40 repeat protein
VALAAPAAPPADKAARLDAAGDPLPAGTIARLGTTRFRTGETLGVVTMSPDGKLLAAGGDEEGIRLLDAVTGKPLRRIKSENPPASMTFSPDGKVLAAAEGGTDVQLYDTATGREKHKLSAPPAQIVSAAFSGDGKFVCGYGSNATVKAPMPVWETATGKLVASLTTLHTQQTGVSLSADGKLLAVCGTLQPGLVGGEKITPEEAGRTVQLWDVAKGKELRRLVAESGSFTNVAFSPDGKTVAASWGTATLTFWDVATGKEVRRCSVRRSLGAALLYSPDGKYLAVAGDPGPVQLWDAATGKRLRSYDPPPDFPARPYFPAAGKALAYSNTDKAVIIYDLLAGKLLTPEGGHAEAVQAIVFRAGGKEVVTASADGRVCVWDAAGKEVRRSQPRLGPDDESVGRAEGASAILSPDGRHLLTNGFGEGRLHDAATGEALLSLEDNGGGVFAAAFSADGSQFATAGTVGAPAAPGSALRVYETATGRHVRELGSGVQPTAIAFAPDGKLLSAVVQDGGNMTVELRAWDLTTGKQRWQNNITAPEGGPLAFSPDGRLLACATEEGVVTLYESATGRELRGLTRGKDENVRAVRFSPDGRLLAAAYTLSGHQPSRVRVWELATGTVRHVFTGHTGEVLSLCFAPDGKRLASGSADTTILLWDLTGRAGEEAPTEKPTAEELDKLWAGLDDPDARPAHQAMRRLAASPDEAVALLTKHVKPAAAKVTDAAEINRLIAALDADSFEEREKAEKGLEALGASAGPALRKVLEGNPPAEVKRRVEGLLDKLKDRGTPPPELVRPLRAVEVLENLATPEARKLLETLAKGAPEAPLTVAARAVLGRLEQARK